MGEGITQAPKHLVLRWINLSTLAFCAVVAVFEIIIFYVITSLSVLGFTPSYTIQEVAHSLNFQTMKISVSFYLVWGLGICIVNAIIWRILKTSVQFKSSLIISLSRGLVLAFPLITIISTIFYSDFPRFRVLGIGLSALLWPILSLILFRFYQKEPEKKQGIEIALVSGLIILIIANIIRITLFFKYKIENPITVSLVLIFTVFIFAFLLWLFRPLRIRIYEWSIIVKLRKGIIVLIIAFGALLGSGLPLTFYSLTAFACRLKVIFPRITQKYLEIQIGAQKQMPNVVLVVWDTVRADHLSLYGYNRKTTPFLDSLAEEAVVFNRAFSTSCSTIPSHASIFTGLYPSEHNCHTEHLKLDQRFTTLAEKYKELGYITLGYTNNASLNRYTGFAQGFDFFEVFSSYGIFSGDMAYFYYLNTYFPEYSRDQGARSTERTVGGWLPLTKQFDAPFFLFVNYMEAHLPYPWTFRAFRFFENPGKARRQYLGKSLVWDYFYCQGGISPETRQSAINWYDGSIYYLDFMTSRLLDLLSKEEVLDNTIFVLVSDHGESFGEHKIFGHITGLYQNLTWVPFLIYWPGHLEPMRIDKNVSLRELPEILLTLSRGNIPAQLKPISEEQPLVYAENFMPVHFLERISSFCEKPIDLSLFERREKMVIKDDYKLLWSSNTGYEFYNLKTDPAELQDIKASPDFPALQEALEEFMKQPPFKSEPPKRKLDQEIKRTLKALQYAR